MTYTIHKDTRGFLLKQRRDKLGGSFTHLQESQLKEIEQQVTQAIAAIDKSQTSTLLIPVENTDPKKHIMIINNQGETKEILITRQLGTGTSGVELMGVVVYEGIDLRTGQEYAIKETNTNNPEPPKTVTQEREALKRAGDNLGQSRGPCLNIKFDSRKDVFAEYTVMPKAQGDDLDKILYLPNRDTGQVTKQALPEIVSLATAASICRQVRELHDAGLIHRDLKPGNIHVTPDGKVKIIDLGEALIHENGYVPDSIQGTITAPIVGTPGYIAPETEGVDPDKYVKSEKKYSAKSDTYATGLTLAELLFPDINAMGRREELKKQMHENGKIITIDENLKEKEIKTTFEQSVHKYVQMEILYKVAAKAKDPKLSALERMKYNIVHNLVLSDPDKRRTMDETIQAFNQALLTKLEMDKTIELPLPREVFIDNIHLSTQEARLHQYFSNNQEFLNQNADLLISLKELQGQLATLNPLENNFIEMSEIAQKMQALEKQIAKLEKSNPNEIEPLKKIVADLKNIPSLKPFPIMNDMLEKIADQKTKAENKYTGLRGKIASDEDKEKNKNLINDLEILEKLIQITGEKGSLTDRKHLNKMNDKLEFLLNKYKEDKPMANLLKDLKGQLTEINALVKTRVVIAAAETTAKREMPVTPRGRSSSALPPVIKHDDDHKENQDQNVRRRSMIFRPQVKQEDTTVQTPAEEKQKYKPS